IRSAQEFGFKVYYGDGTRLDVLRACGAEKSRAIAVCVDDRAAANRIVELARAEFSQAKLLVRAFDREHARELVDAGVDYQVRETFDAALRFGQEALVQLGVSEVEARQIAELVRSRDAERFALELASGDYQSGKSKLFVNTRPLPSRPTPFSPPRREGQALNEIPGEGDAAAR